MAHSNDSTSSLARLVPRDAHPRQASAWIRRKRGASRIDTASERQRTGRHSNMGLKTRAWLSCAYGCALVGLVIIFLSIVRPSPSNPPSPAVYAIFCTLIAIFGILFLYTVLRIGILAHGRRRSRASRQRHRRHQRPLRLCLPRSAHDLLTDDDGPRRIAIVIRRQRKRTRRPANLAPASLYSGGANQWRYPAAYNDPDRLPDDDSVYSPTTPMRVHVVSEEQLETEKPTSPAVAHFSGPPTHRRAQSSRHSQTTVSPLSRHSSSHDLEAAADVPDAMPQPLAAAAAAAAAATSATATTAAAATATSTTDGPTAPPPAYGLWRCSVRADPNLLHWAPSPGHSSLSTPQEVHMSGAAATSSSVPRPPSYTFVSEGSPSPTETLRGPEEEHVVSPLESVPRIGDWALPQRAAAVAPREVVLDEGDAVSDSVAAIHEVARAMLREDIEAAQRRPAP